MSALNSVTCRIAIALSFSLLLVSACSSSTNNQPSTVDDVANADQVSIIANDGNESNVSDGLSANGSTGAIVAANSTAGGTQTTTPVQDPTTQNPITENPITQNPVASNPVIPDPISQNSTRVNVDIQVPAYQSNELNVSLVWGNKAFAASWVGDEFWSASDDFPTDSEQQLIVTFSDANGDIILGSFETTFKTGTNASMFFQITADQFDTNRWDSDNDGISNLAELIAKSESTDSKRVLLFSETRGFRHESIADALVAQDASIFKEKSLSKYNVIIFLHTTGNILDNAQQLEFNRWIQAGGGFVGIHAAADTEYEWPWYGGLVGAYFARHPPIQTASQNIEDASHLSTAHLDLTWTRTDEWYDYRDNPRAQVNVLLSLDEASYTGGEMGDDHPSAWYHAYDGGRAWYTGGGHTRASYAEPDFRKHLLGGLLYAAEHDGL